MVRGISQVSISDILCTVCFVLKNRELSFNGNLGGSLPAELGQLAALQTL